MELDFLGKNLQYKTEEKSEPEKPIDKVVDIEYNKSKAMLAEYSRENYPIPLDLPYIQRGVEYAVNFGYEVKLRLKEVLVSRANREKVLTVREADIAFRRKLDLNNQFLVSIMVGYTGFLVEDNSSLTEGVFDTRIRYNKGLQWRKNIRPTSDPEKQEIGDNRILMLEKMLEIFGLPLHPEEKISGIHPEFHKPEYLSWDQFNKVYMDFQKSKSLAVRLHLQEIENTAKELIGEENEKVIAA